MNFSSDGRVSLWNSLKGSVFPRNTTPGQRPGIHNYFQQQSLSRANIGAIYGTDDQFYAAYEEFERRYYAAISNSKNIAQGKSVNAGLMKTTGRIDLSILNKKTSKELRDYYATHILKLDQVLASTGLPGVQLPSANLYAGSFRFRLENAQGAMHPAQLLLNRTIFNVHEGDVGVDALRFGTSSLISSRALRQYSQDPSEMIPQGARKVFVFDVETTGVTSTSQVRSMSMAQMLYDDTGRMIGGPTSISAMNMAFESPMLSGITVSNLNGGTVSMTEFLAQSEFGVSADTLRSRGQLFEMGQGGQKYLDQLDIFLNKLMEADAVAGHNVGFDLDMMIRTAERVSGSSMSDHRVMQTIERFYQKVEGGNFLIDSLESTRNYLLAQVEEMVGQSSSGINVSSLNQLDDEARKFVNGLFAQETLARVHIGGSASYASVENVALNTNLFELIENSGKAEELYDLINKGSHIAETDTILQSYIMEYVRSGELKITDISARSDFGRMARAKIVQSQAITPTTNIASVQHISNTVLNYVTSEEGARGVSLLVSRNELNLPAGQVGQLPQEGILQYKDGGYKFVTSEGVEDIVDQNFARNFIVQRLNAAQAPAADRVRVGNVTRLTNNAANSIIDLGISFQQASTIDQLRYVADGRRGPVLAVSNITAEDLQESIGTLYRELGNDLSVADQFRVVRGEMPEESVFQQGFNAFSQSKSLEIAERFSRIGDPYAFLDVNSRVFSAVMAQSTAARASQASASELRAINQGVSSVAGRTISDIAYTANADLISELGITYARASGEAALFGDITQTAQESGIKRVIAPLEVLQESMRRTGMDRPLSDISISFFQKYGGEDAANIVFNVNRSMAGSEARTLAESMFNILSDAGETARVMGMDESALDDTVKTTVAKLQDITRKGGKQEHIQKLADMLMSNGVVIGDLGEGESITLLREQMERAGFATGNDILLSQQTSTIIDTLGEAGDRTVVLAPFRDERAVKAAGQDVVDQLLAADSGEAIGRLNKIAEAVEGSKDQVRTNLKRAKIGMTGNNLLEIYEKLRSKAPIIAGAAAAVGAGYYVSKRMRERSLYSETLAQQEYESGRSNSYMNDSAQEFIRMNSYRSDPLTTAGVVGNLDRSKIGHTQMGNNKYNHLFGGQ